MPTYLWFSFIVSVLSLACKASSRFRYMLRFVLFMLYTFISTLVFVPFMLHKPRNSKNGLMPAWAVRFLTKWLLGVTYEMRGHENILPEGDGCVVLVNHQSSLDIVLMTYIWQLIPNGHTVTKREVFWVYPFPWLWNTVFIDKLNPEKAQNDINNTGALITTNKARICMFPEGTRHQGDTLLPFKKGAFHIALAAQCAIQPVVCSKYSFLDARTHKFDSGHSIIEFLPAIPTKGLKKEDLPRLMEQVRSVMQAAFTRLSAEAETNSKKTS